MKNIKKIMAFFAVMVLTLSLAACATTAEKLQTGKTALKSKDYATALETFKPLAEDGNANAQYALGYMYYYCLGVVEDQQKARQYITAAAKQKQPDAELALVKMNQSPQPDSGGFVNTNTNTLITGASSVPPTTSTGASAKQSLNK